MQNAKACFAADELPDHIWMHILEFLPGQFVGKVVSRVSQRFYEISNSNALWKASCELKYGKSTLERDDNHELNWKQRYIEQAYLNNRGALKWSQPRMFIKPPARSRHTMNAVGSRLVIIGGRAGENLFQFDLKSKRFSRYQLIDSEAPGNISNHTAVVHDNKIYVFGGVGDENVKNNYLYELDVDKHRWSAVNMYGTVPRPRSDHAACVIGNKMYVVGGSSQTVTAMNDVHCFDFDTLRWEELVPESQVRPDPRSGHCIVAVENRLYLFGGGVWDREHMAWTRKFNDLHTFDIETREWRLLTTSGVVPTTSKYASVFSVDRYIIVAGGASIYNDDVTDETYILDTVTLNWQIAPEKLSQKLDSASICLCGDRAYMFGGYCCGDKDTFSVLDLNWKKKASRFSRIRQSFSAPTILSAIRRRDNCMQTGTLHSASTNDLHNRLIMSASAPMLS